MIRYASCATLCATFSPSLHFPQSWQCSFIASSRIARVASDLVDIERISARLSGRFRNVLSGPTSRRRHQSGDRAARIQRKIPNSIRIMSAADISISVPAFPPGVQSRLRRVTFVGKRGTRAISGHGENKSLALQHERPSVLAEGRR